MTTEQRGSDAHRARHETAVTLRAESGVSRGMRTLLVLFLLSSVVLLSTLLAGSA
jgi:hypothetical protein